MSRRALAALGVGAALVLALPAGAEAATFCVKKPKCVSGGGIPQGILASAIVSAGLNGNGVDRIELGPQTFNEGPWAAGANNPVRIVGAGPRKTTLARAANGDGQTVLSLPAPGSGVSGVEVKLGGARA